MPTILITGANRGIGLELSRQYAAAGEFVIACHRAGSKTDGLRALEASGNPMKIEDLDVTDEASVAKLALAVDGKAIDVLINNAGTMGGFPQDLGGMDYDGWAQAFEVNAIGPFRVITALMSSLKLADTPRAITLTSQMGALHRQSGGSYAYRSSKAAANKVMQVLSLDLRNEGIIVCPMHPGWVRTDMGGPNADLPVKESAAGLINVISGLTTADSGRFLQWDGVELEW